MILIFIFFIAQAQVFANESLLTQKLSSPLTNESSSFLDLRNVLLLKNNELLKPPYQWSVSNPYTELTWRQKISKDTFFKLGAEFSYENQKWDYFISKLFFEHTFDFWIPLNLKWGYFDIDYIESNSLLINKTPLVEQSLFPNGKEALGLSLRTEIDSSWSFIFALRFNDYQKASLDLKTSNKKTIWSLHTVYEKEEQSFFAGWFRQDPVQTGPMNSIGAGSQLKLPYQFLSLNLKTEAWSIQQKASKSFVWYFFPYVKLFNKVGFGYFLGSFQEQSARQTAQQFETAVKLDLYLKDSIHFSVEKIQEYSSVFSHSSWDFSLKTHLIIPFKLLK